MNGRGTKPEEKKLAEAFLKAIPREVAAREEHEKAVTALQQARAEEEAAKEKLVLAMRALTLAVQQKFLDEPARAREVLGWAEPTRKKSAGGTKAANKAKGKKKDEQKTEEPTSADPKVGDEETPGGGKPE